MTRKKFVTKNPVKLDGYQAVLKPSKYGYGLQALIDDELVQELEADREQGLEWAKSKLKNPNRSSLRPEPWEQVSDKLYKVKFEWDEETKPVIVDSEGTVITSTDLPLYSGSTVKIAFTQKAYVMKDGFTYGTTIKKRLTHIQIVSLSSSAGVDSGDMETEDVLELFGKTKGFKADDPNVTPAPAADFDDDF
jgi:hypothetical protein